MLLYLFYGLPLLAAFGYGLWTPGCTWMLDWTVLFAGAVAQAPHESKPCRGVSVLCTWYCHAFRGLNITAVRPSVRQSVEEVGASGLMWGPLHPRTPYTYRVPEGTWWPVMTLNALYAAGPLLLALRCALHPAFFLKPAPKGHAPGDAPGNAPGNKKND
ncbi:hypothetical protein AAFF_G00324030 [Aldrovandia affinis]|uniref:Uncharacterized protein n=1 Tax=Aldrovandia affinis TaxID=143900 RepID=A0AAD7W0M3_9TELE|nr:hypothetical protein AAFF_G00324030 [Aldrovandia affinis]